MYIHGQFAQGALPLVDVYWQGSVGGHYLVFGQNPADIAGVSDHQIEFQLRTKSKLWSDKRKAWFEAAREVRLLGPGDKSISVIQCGTGANINYCDGGANSAGNGTYSEDPCGLNAIGFGTYGSEPTEAISGLHVNCWGAVGNDTGKDWYMIMLLNC